MKYFLPASSVSWAWLGSEHGSGTIPGLICYVIAAIFFTGWIICEEIARTATAKDDR